MKAEEFVTHIFWRPVWIALLSYYFSYLTLDVSAGTSSQKGKTLRLNKPHSVTQLYMQAKHLLTRMERQVVFKNDD